MNPDLWELYRQMLRSRLFEAAVMRLWQEGQISGEMHLGMGEEAIAAGVVAHLQDGDALALDHRGTPPLLMRGVDPVLLLREFLGRADGLCAGMGGHMHLFSPSHLAASSGIVGAAGPAAAGFALAAQLLRPGTVAVAFFGEGAMNQGMLLEALNLAVVWQLPALFVCKDSSLAVTTPAPWVIGGKLVERARGFGMRALEVDGGDAEAVWQAAREWIVEARNGGGPGFLHAHCVHLEGHFLGDALLRMTREPLRETRQRGGPLLRALTARHGTRLGQRMEGMRTIANISQLARKQTGRQGDPIERLRRKLTADVDRLEQLEEQVEQETQEHVEAALRPA